jgi:UDP-N-acetylmuramate dehydrogenase
MRTYPGLDIQHDIQLSGYSTMGVTAQAKYFIVLDNTEILAEIVDFIKLSKLDFLVLGGGSNLLFVGDYAGVVLKNEIMGKEIVKENDEYVYLKCGSGENWHTLVEFCVAKGWYGIENLALIPGTVGAAPIQNIGAYGAELSDVFINLETFNFIDKTIKIVDKTDCKFGYRDSIFKNKLKKTTIVTAITLKLKKNGSVNTEYGALKNYLIKHNIQTPSIKDVFEAVINIRKSKLPDPDEIGNTGSFFKNPIVDTEKYKQLKSKYSSIPSYQISHKQVKIPAAWLIDEAGWKGYRQGDAGVHVNQALVLVNYGKASGREIELLSHKIQLDVQEKFGVKLEPEVNIIKS